MVFQSNTQLAPRTTHHATPNLISSHFTSSNLLLISAYFRAERESSPGEENDQPHQPHEEEEVVVVVVVLVVAVAAADSHLDALVHFCAFLAQILLAVVAVAEVHATHSY